MRSAQQSGSQRSCRLAECVHRSQTRAARPGTWVKTYFGRSSWTKHQSTAAFVRSFTAFVAPVNDWCAGLVVEQLRVGRHLLKTAHPHTTSAKMGLPLRVSERATLQPDKIPSQTCCRCRLLCVWRATCWVDSQPGFATPAV